MEVVLGSLEEIPENGMTEFSIDGQCILVCRTGDVVHAVGGICPHRGAQLGQGTLNGASVVCPWHEWEFDVSTGCGVTNPISTLPTYPIVVKDGKVVVTLPGR